MTSLIPDVVYLGHDKGILPKEVERFEALDVQVNVETPVHLQDCVSNDVSLLDDIGVGIPGGQQLREALCYERPSALVRPQLELVPALVRSM